MPNGQVNENHGKGNEGHEAPTRRHFLRRAGVIGAVTAAFIGGGAELAGVSAFASAKSNKNQPNGRPGVCTYDAGHCGSGGCPHGFCCYRCVCGSRVSYGCEPVRSGGCTSYVINCV